MKVRNNYQQARWDEPIIFDLSVSGMRGMLIPAADREVKNETGDVFAGLPEELLRKEAPKLPELSQKLVLSHYLHLSQETLGANLNPDISQGTCTMKYNPRVNEELVDSPGMANLHPYQPDETIQGILEIYYKFEQILRAVSGLDRFSFQPGGGAHAAFAAARIMKKYHSERGEGDQRDEIITTIFSHPCDAASPSTVGFKVITLYPDENGYPDLGALKAAVSERTAGIFVTNPEDTGIYNPLIDEFTQVVHAAGGLCYYDQANANGLLGITRAREAGFDMCHFNLHKTFSSPHGCSGPATGALGINGDLVQYSPVPTVEFDGEKYYLNFNVPKSIGKVRTFYGVAPVILRSYAWAMMHGPEGLREVAEISVLNNNYLEKKIREIQGVDVWYAKGHRRLEQVRYSWQPLMEDTGVGTEDIRRRIGDFGIQNFFMSHHPWVVPEPFTLEPCEAYSQDDLDEYAAVLAQIAQEARENPEFVRSSPHKCAAQKIADADFLEREDKWIITWRQYLKKKSEGMI